MLLLLPLLLRPPTIILICSDSGIAAMSRSVVSLLCGSAPGRWILWLMLLRLHEVGPIDERGLEVTGLLL